MPRKQVGRPKSKSKPQKQKKLSFLGESSASPPSNAESFHSPESEPDHTDYGFNYTSTSPQHSRRSNVTRPISTEEHSQVIAGTSQNSTRRSNSDRQNESNSSQRVQQMPGTSGRSIRSETSNRSPRTSERSPKRRSFIPQSTRNSNRDPSQPTKKNARKQKTPQQRDRIMWDQIRELQKREGNITAKAPFGRLIRELLIQFSSDATRITLKALEALQISSEIYLTQFFTDAYVCTLHRGRVTLGVHDLRLVRYLRGPQDPGNC